MGTLYTLDQYILPSNNRPDIIGIIGHARSGKDTVADRFYDRLTDCYALPFAYPLKDAMAAAFGLPLHENMSSEVKEKKNEFWNVSPREILQYAGTEIFREQIGELVPHIGHNFWIKRHYGTLAGIISGADGEPVKYDKDDLVIVPDVRFPNEIAYIRNNGGSFIHLTRPGFDGNIGIPGHASEAPLSHHLKPGDKVYPIINDSTLENLYEKIDTLIDHLYPA